MSDANGNLYGTTTYGGKNDLRGWMRHGLRALAAGAGQNRVALTTLYAFANYADGAEPVASLYLDHGALYGTTVFGGGTDVVKLPSVPNLQFGHESPA